MSDTKLSEMSDWQAHLTEEELVFWRLSNAVEATLLRRLAEAREKLAAVREWRMKLSLPVRPWEMDTLDVILEVKGDEAQ